MSKALSYRDVSGRTPISPGTMRKIQREEELIVAAAQLANEQDIAQAMYVAAAMPRFGGLTREARQMMDEDPLNAEILPVLAAYRDDVVERVRRLGR